MLFWVFLGCSNLDSMFQFRYSYGMYYSFLKKLYPSVPFIDQVCLLGVWLVLRSSLIKLFQISKKMSRVPQFLTILWTFDCIFKVRDTLQLSLSVCNSFYLYVCILVIKSGYFNLPLTTSYEPVVNGRITFFMPTAILAEV